MHARTPRGCVCACKHAHARKEFNLETIIGAQRRTGKSYCYNAQIINHSDILLALSLYIPLKWCLAQIVRGQTLNRPGLKCRSQTPSPLPLKLHRTRQLTLDVLSEETSHQHGAELTKGIDSVTLRKCRGFPLFITRCSQSMHWKSDNKWGEETSINLPLHC